MSTTNNNTNSDNNAGPVLVVGARGMLGSVFARCIGTNAVFAHAAVDPVDQEELDITDVDATKRYIATLRPAIIINCAAYTNVDGAEEHEDVATRVNGDGVRNLAVAAKGIGARLVHFSTDYVFDGAQEAGYAEDAHPAPLNAYGCSKRPGEEVLALSGADYLLIRTAWLYGPNGKNFVDTMREKMKSGEALQVVDDQIGCPTYAADLAEATLSLLARKAPAGTYHLVNSGRVSWFGFAQEFQKILGTDVQLTAVSSDAFPRPTPRPQYSVLQNTKTPPLPAWEDAVGRYLMKVVDGRL